ncbi:transposase [Atopobium sp. oral taxon 416]|uniref:transposase n=1 Tax=Atopobium sp. oral taxon 416 TaxID=712157 RepID=UPI002112CA56|nr:transposase [Atopobium sp. oral taxon 416]
MDELREDAPSGARVVKDAELAALAYLSFPRQQCLKIRTNNVMQRMNGKLKRRGRIVQVFPSTGSVMRLLAGIIGKLNAEWECGRLFMSKESLEPVFSLKRAKMRIGKLEEGEEAHSEARVIMKLAIDKYERAA